MTEAEWLTCDDSTPMLEFMRGRASDRKVALAAIHACRTLWNLCPLESLRTGLTICERYAEGRSSPSEVTRLLVVLVSRFQTFDFAASDPDHRGKRDVVFAILSLVDAISGQAFGMEQDLSQRAQWLIPHGTGHAHVIRDIFGNPFRPIVFSPAWRTDTAVSLAKGMYESRDFSAMPILADALQDAGCEQTDILNHCRDEKQVHVRGCWVVDLVLGKG